MTTKPLAITAGEPAGIGFDIILQSIEHLQDCIVIADQNELLKRARLLGINVEVCRQRRRQPHQLRVKHIPVSTAVTCGQLEPENAPYVLACLDAALQGCLRDDYAGLVTAPLHKGVINDAGIAFTGHTEYLAEQTHADAVMLLVADRTRVALATTHLPVSQVAGAISAPLITRVVTVLHKDLTAKFAITNPHIAVCALNPHAGEQGYLGREEIDIITPTLQALEKSGINVSGPHPADTIFTPKQLQSADAVLAMYHDQGLPVLKHIGFGQAVNTTLGLPVIRTSVDHGAALRLAGSGLSDAGSLLAAIELARWQAGQAM